MYKIISYYTPNYKDTAEKYLISSVNKLNLNNYITEVPSLGSWKENTNYKPIFIRECLKKFEENLLWIDCDATINSYPFYFDQLDKSSIDFAYHLLSWKTHYGRPRDENKFEFLSGTLFFRKNDLIKQFIDIWIECSKEISPDQKSLEYTFKKFGNLNTEILPREYCYIETLPNGNKPFVPLENPVISHYQASRNK